MIEVKCMGPVCIVERPEKLTGGMVGKKIHFSFDEAWAGLTRQAVLWTEGCKRVMTLPLGNTVEIPAELLAVPVRMLWVGVRGYDANMTLVIPTDWGELGEIVPGTEAVPGGEAPTPTQAQQLQWEIDEAAGKAQRAEDAAAEALRRVEGAEGAAARAEDAAVRAETAGKSAEELAVGAGESAHLAQAARSEAERQAVRAKEEADRAVQSGVKSAAELSAEVPPGLAAEGNVQSVLGALAGLLTEVDGLIGGGIHG